MVFDPYRKWLGIPQWERPANHYRLLGITLFENDPDVVEASADRQMVHVRNYQAGQHSELSQNILNQLSAARVCLLSSEKKKAYDEQLRTELAQKAGQVQIAGQRVQKVYVRNFDILHAMSGRRHSRQGQQAKARQ